MFFLWKFLKEKLWAYAIFLLLGLMYEVEKLSIIENVFININDINLDPVDTHPSSNSSFCWSTTWLQNLNMYLAILKAELLYMQMVWKWLPYGFTNCMSIYKWQHWSWQLFSRNSRNWKRQWGKKNSPYSICQEELPASGSI